MSRLVKMTQPTTIMGVEGMEGRLRQNKIK